MATVLESVIAIIEEHVVLSKAGTITGNALLVDGLGLDSLDVLSVCGEIESHFDIEQFDYDPRTMSTVGDVAGAIDKILKAQSQTVTPENGASTSD